ncbi:MAG: hypothetical protein PWP21_1022 [Thermosediminibacterales bacterium]|nr:hypothetical protein [Thermosediminibacterales bacterium]
MRFISIDNLKEGQVLARNIYNTDCAILLAKGTTLKESYIKKLKERGYNGVYIEDENTDSVETEPVRQEVKIKTIAIVKNAFTRLQKGYHSQEDIVNIKKQVEEIIDELIKKRHVLLNMADIKIFDEYIFFHSVNVAIISMIIGIAAGFDRKRLYELGMGAIFHDAGKIFIEKDILNKKGKLNDREREIINTHPLKGYQFLKEKLEHDIPIKSRLVALQHHERYDGIGYPKQLHGSEIHIYSRIAAVADVYDAMISDRCYRKALPVHEVVEHIMGGSGRMFDPEVVKLFLQKIMPYPVGSKVVLSNSMEGYVVRNYSDCSLRPVVRVVQQNGIKINPVEIDLKNDRRYSSVTIVQVASEEGFSA